MMGVPKIENFLTFRNPRTSEYRELIQAVGQNLYEGGAVTGEKGLHSKSWFDPLIVDQDVENTLKGYLPSRPLIDLGGGSLSIMGKFAETYQAGPYNNVEITYRSTSELPATEDIEKFKPATPPVIVKMDILDFLSKLDPKGIYAAANYTINGIDEIVIENDRYHEAIARELGRFFVPLKAICSKKWERPEISLVS